MSFEDIPEDKQESHPCPICEDGNVTENNKGDWVCDNCDSNLSDVDDGQSERIDLMHKPAEF